MIRVDLHVHTAASYDHEDKSEPWVAVVDAASEAGLDAIAITDHNTFEGYARVTRALKKLARRDGGRYSRLSNVKVLPGIEVSCLGGHGGLHLVGIFDPDGTKLGFLARSLRLSTAVPNELSGGTRLDVHPDEVARVIHRYGGVVVAAHVATRNGLLHECRPEVARTLAQKCCLNALEYSRETGREQDASLAEAERLAGDLGIPLIASSDAHVSTAGTVRGRWGVGERYTELDCDRADFASIRDTLVMPHKVYREKLDTQREPWRDQARLRRAVRGGKTLTFDYIYSDGDIVRIVKATNSLLNARGGSLLVGVGGGRERVRIGSKRLRLSETELKARIEGSMNPTPDIDVLGGELGDGWRVMQVLVDKRQNPLFYFAKDGSAYTRDKGRVKPLELTCDLVVAPFLRQVARSALLDRGRLLARVEELRTNRRAALLTLRELIDIFPLRRYMDELPEVHELLVESIVEAAARARDPRLCTWARELDISPAVAERIMADKARQYHWGLFQTQQYKPLVERAGTTRRQRGAVSAAHAALKRQYLERAEELTQLDTPLTGMAENLGFLLEWREPRLSERMQRLADDAQRDLQRLLSAIAGRMDTFILEIGEAGLEVEGLTLVQELLVMPDTQLARRAEEPTGGAGVVMLVPTETPVSLTIDDMLELFVDEEQLEDDEAVRERLEHVIRAGMSGLPIWVWIRQFSSKLAVDSALVELEGRREVRQTRIHVLRRIKRERAEPTLDDLKPRVAQLVRCATSQDDADALQHLVHICMHHPPTLERCRQDGSLTTYLVDCADEGINPRSKLFRRVACLLTLFGLEHHILRFLEAQASGPTTLAGVEALALSGRAEAIPVLEACLHSETRGIPNCAACCLVWRQDYGVSGLKDLVGTRDGEPVGDMDLRVVARAMGQCRLEEFHEAVEFLADWATGEEYLPRAQAREGLVTLDKRRYLPEAKAKFGWMEGAQ